MREVLILGEFVSDSWAGHSELQAQAELAEATVQQALPNVEVFSFVFTGIDSSESIQGPPTPDQRQGPAALDQPR